MSQEPCFCSAMSTWPKNNFTRGKYRWRKGEPTKLLSAERSLGQGRDLFPRGEFEADPGLGTQRQGLGSTGGKSLCKILWGLLGWKERNQPRADWLLSRQVVRRTVWAYVHLVHRWWLIRTWGNKKWDGRVCWGHRGWGPQVVGSAGKPGWKSGIQCIGQKGLYLYTPVQEHEEIHV